MEFIKKLVILVMFAPLLARAGDCIPLALEELSKDHGSPVSYETWYKDLMPDGKTSPDIRIAIQDWRGRCPSLPIVCVYSVFPEKTEQFLVVSQFEIKFNEAYLWIGIMSDSLIEKSTDNSHAAIAFFNKDNVTLIHPRHEGMPVIETLDYRKFLSRTYLVFSVFIKDR